MGPILNTLPQQPKQKPQKYVVFRMRKINPLKKKKKLLVLKLNNFTRIRIWKDSSGKSRTHYSIPCIVVPAPATSQKTGY